MTKTNYSEKLRDPRWQKKRLEIFNRDKFTCVLCLDKSTTLHVHHEEYFGDPWEAENGNLKTLCAHCHSLLSAGKVEDKIISVLKHIEGNTLWFVIKTECKDVAFCTYNTISEQWQGVLFGEKSWKTVSGYLNESENPNEE